MPYQYYADSTSSRSSRYPSPHSEYAKGNVHPTSIHHGPPLHPLSPTSAPHAALSTRDAIRHASPHQRLLSPQHLLTRSRPQIRCQRARGPLRVPRSSTTAADPWPAASPRARSGTAANTTKLCHVTRVVGGRSMGLAWWDTGGRRWTRDLCTIRCGFCPGRISCGDCFMLGAWRFVARA